MRTGRPSHRDKVLAALPGTINQVAKRSGVSRSTVGKWLLILAAERLVYVSRWVSLRNGPVPFYRLRVRESSVDAPKPPPQTDADYQRRFNEKHPGRRAEIREAYYVRLKAPKIQAASWLALLSTPITKHKPSSRFPDAVEQENA